MHWFYYVGRFLTRILLFLLTHREVKGKENVPKQGPLLIAANHLNLADPPIIGVSINRKAMFLAKEELFHSRFSKHIMRSFGAFPIRRGGMNRESMRKARQFLAQDMAIIMFPEGRRSLNTQLESAFSGAALIASRSSAPILPIGIFGTEKIKGMSWFLRRPRITVNIGASFYLPPVNGKLNRAQLTEFTHSIMEHIAELLPPEYRGNYASRKSRSNESRKSR
ncbi:1-acyl-sn-glycerol-3-phosphate acyltransferase [subsurface metagenome]